MNIKRRVANLCKKYGTKDPYKLCKMLKINVLYVDLGNVKGVYKKVLTNKFIVLNEKMDAFCQKVVLTHELGHAILHNSQNIQTLKDYNLFPETNSKIELEANIFTAELLIDDDFFCDESIENPSIDIKILEQLKELKYKNEV